MRLPRSAHTDRPWLIHEIAYDFRVEDVWALPTLGERDDFPQLVRLLTTADLFNSGSIVVRTLFAIRFKLGSLFGLDAPETGVGARVPSLRDRLPDALRDSVVPGFESLPFKPLYLIDDEFAAEIANRTVHGVVHLGWVADAGGGYRGQMAILVKPNGLLGSSYMAAIQPFRHFLVYPAAIRRIERVWKVSGSSRTAAESRSPSP